MPPSLNGHKPQAKTKNGAANGGFSCGQVKILAYDNGHGACQSGNRIYVSPENCRYFGQKDVASHAASNARKHPK